MKIRIPILLALWAGLAACGKPAGSSTPVNPAIPVEVSAAALRGMPVEMKAIGIVEPIASVQLKSKVTGEILKVHFADGAQVRAGEPLFSIDPRAFQAALDRARANLEIAEATASNATEQAQRYTTLIQRGVASKEQTSQFLSNAKSLKAELAARQADINEAQLSLDWTEITAPISGRAGAALLKPGNIIQANTDTLAVINQMQPIYVTFSLPENTLAEVREWMTRNKPVVSAYDPDNGKLLGTGSLDFIDNAVDRATGMVAFKATFPNENETLWPGQFVDVTLELAIQPEALVVPSTAVMEGQQGSQVFVVMGDTVALRKVKVERTVGNLSIIRKGLEPGERVVTVGQLRLNPGAKVEIKKQQKAEDVPTIDKTPE
ncbi:MAG: efflux RND transporter periplasmic adaptor subunit [Verrucomicrobia bacterium]|nr:efflux RND transporter periplasmic adaptor subunit [Verrucomicrobiota bacterium]